MDFNVVLDGANIGFANANNRENAKNGLYLNADNIDRMVTQFQDQHLSPLVILHSYHLHHLQSRKDQLEILDVPKAELHHV